MPLKMGTPKPTRQNNQVIKNFLTLLHRKNHKPCPFFAINIFIVPKPENITAQLICVALGYFLRISMVFKNILTSFCEVNDASETKYLDRQSMNTFSNNTNKDPQVNDKRMATKAGR